MDHADHVRLLKGGVAEPGGVWADFGSGTGAFTLALADLIGPDGEIYSVDKDGGSLREQERQLRTRFPGRLPSKTHFLVADFTRRLDLPRLDGIVMANALHFQRHKEPVIELVRGYLRPGGSLILVEYNTDRGNPWVPYPLSFQSWQDLARRLGFSETRLLTIQPSRFLREIYSASSR